MRILRGRLQKSRYQRRSQFGFSLTEIIVAAIITVLIAQATAAGLLINARIQSDSGDEAAFLRVVNQDIERVRDVATALCRQGTNSYGDVGACDPTADPNNSLRARCQSTAQNNGLGDLLNDNLPAFTNNTITDNNGATVTVARNPAPEIIRPNGGLSFSNLRLNYSATVTTGNNQSRSLAYVAEVVPTAIGWCSSASAT